VGSTFCATIVKIVGWAMSTFNCKLKESPFVRCQLLTISCFICQGREVGATSNMALSSPLNSFHLTPLFLILCCQAIASNFMKVCTLKKVYYLANLTSTTTTFESLCFHCITWPCNTCTTIFVSKSIWASKLVTIFCDSSTML